MAGCCLFAESGVSCQGQVLELRDSLLFRPFFAKWDKLGCLWFLWEKIAAYLDGLFEERHGILGLASYLWPFRAAS